MRPAYRELSREVLETAEFLDRPAGKWRSVGSVFGLAGGGFREMAIEQILYRRAESAAICS